MALESLEFEFDKHAADPVLLNVVIVGDRKKPLPKCADLCRRSPDSVRAFCIATLLAKAKIAAGENRQDRSVAQSAGRDNWVNTLANALEKEQPRWLGEINMFLGDALFKASRGAVESGNSWTILYQAAVYPTGSLKLFLADNNNHENRNRTELMANQLLDFAGELERKGHWQNLLLTTSAAEKTPTQPGESVAPGRPPVDIPPIPGVRVGDTTKPIEGLPASDEGKLRKSTPKDSAPLSRKAPERSMQLFRMAALILAIVGILDTGVLFWAGYALLHNKVADSPPSTRESHPLTSAAGNGALGFKSTEWLYDPAIHPDTHTFDLSAIHDLLHWADWDEDERKAFRWALDTCTTDVITQSNLFPARLVTVFMETPQVETNGPYCIKVQLVEFAPSSEGKKSNLTFRFSSTSGLKAMYYLHNGHAKRLPWKVSSEYPDNVKPASFQWEIEGGNTVLMALAQYPHRMFRSRAGYREAAPEWRDWHMINPTEWLRPGSAGIESELAVGSPNDCPDFMWRFQFGTNWPPVFTQNEPAASKILEYQLAEPVRTEIASALKLAFTDTDLVTTFPDPLVIRALSWLAYPTTADTNMVWAYDRTGSLSLNALFILAGRPADGLTVNPSSRYGIADVIFITGIITFVIVVGFGFVLMKSRQQPSAHVAA